MKHHWSGEPYEQTVPGGHMFSLGMDGEVDEWVREDDHCNGPGCVACDRTWCHHCSSGVYQELCPAVEEILDELALFDVPGVEMPKGVDDEL